MELASAAVLSRGAIEIVDRGQIAAQIGEVLLLPSDSNARSAPWMLLAPPESGVRINNAPLENGVRILADRDAIRAGDLPTMYFSTERLARVEPFSGGEDVFCPRDKTLISEGDPSVCCPRCGVWFHEHEGKGCWSYSDTCALCDQHTDLNSATYRWTPGAL